MFTKSIVLSENPKVEICQDPFDSTMMSFEIKVDGEIAAMLYMAYDPDKINPEEDVIPNVYTWKGDECVEEVLR